MYRENISNFLKKEEAKLYLPKNGGLNSYVLDMLPEIGLDVSTGIISKNGKTVGRLEVELERGEDIPQLVDEDFSLGKRSYGLTGDDLFDEFILRNKSKANIVVLNTYDWFDTEAENNRPTLELMNTSGTLKAFGNQPTIAVNKKYLATSTKYLQERFGNNFVVKEYSGNTEKRVGEGKADGCVEIVYGGSTKKSAGLKTAEIVRFSDISLIGPKESIENPWKKEYQQIVQRINNPTESYTSKLLQDPNEILKKFGQESAELVNAFSRQVNLKGEALDVVYSTMLMLAYARKPWDEVEQELYKRWK